MPIPTKRIDKIDNPEANFYTRGQIRADIRADKAKRFAKELPSKMADVIFGEEGRLPWYASMIPGADLVDKISAGKRPGLMDLPGLSDVKAVKAMMIAGVPLRDIFKAFGKKIGKSDDVADAFASRMERLPDELQDATARTIAGKRSAFTGYNIPPISAGNAPVPTRGMGGNTKGAYVNRGGRNNTREIWLRGDDPDQQARSLVGVTAGRALPAELDKFGDIKQSMLTGVPDEGNYGKMLSDMIYGGNKGLFKDMSARGNATELGDYLAKLYNNPNLRYVLENAEGSGESIGELSDVFKQLSGVPLRNNYDKEGKNRALMAMLQGQVEKGQIDPLFEKPMSKKINDFGKGLDASYPKEDLFQLLAGGAESGRMGALANKFRNIGGLDREMVQQNMVPTMMRTMSDRDSNIPFRDVYEKLIKKMPIGDKDPRLTSGKSRKVREYYFDRE